MSEVISLPVNKDYLENISKIQNISSLFEIKINSLKNNKNIDFKAVGFEGAMYDFNLNISNETEKAIKQVAENNVVNRLAVMIFSINEILAEKTAMAFSAIKVKGWVLGTLRIKKTCHGCKADDNWGCLLGYKNENITIKGFEGLSAGRIPLEVCPKPKTNDEYIKLKMQ